MTRDQVIARTQEIFRDIFNDDTLILHDQLSASNLDNWDSLSHVNLLSAIQQEFKIKFELGELHKLKNAGAIIDIIVKKADG